MLMHIDGFSWCLLHEFRLAVVLQVNSTQIIILLLVIIMLYWNLSLCLSYYIAVNIH